MDGMNTNLLLLRGEIDEIDKKLLALFEARMEKVLQIAEYKTACNMAVLDQSREKKVLEKAEALMNPEVREHALTFLKTIMDLSRKLQNDSIRRIESRPSAGAESAGKIVGFQGLPGSFSEQAVSEYFQEVIRKQSYENFEDVFRALQDGEIDYGVLPVENSFTGGITEVYDLLCSYGFYIVGEKTVRVDHILLGLKGTDLDSVREVISHPQAFLQCSKYLKNYPEWKLIPCSNTAVSAKILKDSNAFHQAVIASKRAGELYGLSVLAEGIHNISDNSTRFIIIGRKPEPASENNKISLAVVISHEPGALYRILSYFAEYGLNMLKIESRPRPERKWEYLFYIDFEGNIGKQEVKNAVNSIEKESVFFRMLGNYRADI